MKKSSLIACAIGAGVVGYLVTVYAVDREFNSEVQHSLMQPEVICQKILPAA